MDFAIGIISIVTGIVSLIIGGLAIWLSVFFYNQSKNSEANVKITLAEIKIQAEVMHKVSGRLMERFTKYVTDSPPTER